MGGTPCIYRCITSYGGSYECKGNKQRDSVSEARKEGRPLSAPEKMRMLEIRKDLARLVGELKELIAEMIGESDHVYDSKEYTYEGPGYPRIENDGRRTRLVSLNEDTSFTMRSRSLPQLSGGIRPPIYPGVGETESAFHFYFTPEDVVSISKDRMNNIDFPESRGITGSRMIKDILESTENYRI